MLSKKRGYRVKSVVDFNHKVIMYIIGNHKVLLSNGY